MEQRPRGEVTLREQITQDLIEKKLKVEGYHHSYVTATFDRDLQEDGDYLILTHLKVSGESLEMSIESQEKNKKIGDKQANFYSDGDVKDKFIQLAEKIGLECKTETYPPNQLASEGGFVITVDVPKDMSDKVKKVLNLTTTETETRPDGKKWTTEYDLGKVDFVKALASLGE